MIKVTIKDREALQSVNPFEVELYLIANMWKRESEKERGKIKGLLYTKMKGSEISEIFLPTVEHMDDVAYPSYIASLLMVLETVEEKSQLELWADIKFLKITIQPLFSN